MKKVGSIGNSKVAKSKICKSTQEELEKLHNEFARISADNEERKIKIKEQERVIDHLRERLQKTEESSNITSKTLQLLRRESKNRKQRLINIYKSSFSAMKAEIDFFKKNIRSEIEVMQKIMKNTIESITIKVKESLAQ
jgi:chromosome segregation ATPase